MASPFQSKAGGVALGGVLTAVSLTMLYVATILPSGRLGITAMAGLCPVFASLLSRRAMGYLVWGATSILGLILVPEKGIVLSYVALFGLYPVVKYQFERIPSTVLRWICKLLYGTSGIPLLQFFLLKLLMREPPLWMMHHSVGVFLLGMVAFVLYDIGLSRLISLIMRRLRKG